MNSIDQDKQTPGFNLRFGAGAALGLLIAMLIVWLNCLQTPLILLATILGCMLLFAYLAVRAPDKIWRWINALLP